MLSVSPSAGRLHSRLALIGETAFPYHPNAAAKGPPKLHPLSCPTQRSTHLHFSAGSQSQSKREQRDFFGSIAAISSTRELSQDRFCLIQIIDSVTRFVPHEGVGDTTTEPFPLRLISERLIDTWLQTNAAPASHQFRFAAVRSRPLRATVKSEVAHKSALWPERSARKA